MKFHAAFACFCWVSLSSAFAQLFPVDTLKPSSGFLSQVDSIEQFIHDSRSTVPSSYPHNRVFLDPIRLYQPMGGFMHPLSLEIKPLVFAPLPFIGFAFAFGAQGSQHLKLAYRQSFRKGWIANVDYFSHAGNGFVRNNAWKQRNYQFSVAKRSKLYATSLIFSGLNDTRQFSGGLQIDSLAASFPLDLLPVKKDSCSSSWQMQQVHWKQSLNFLHDSLRFLGLYSQSLLNVNRRVYAEKDTLQGLYPNIYYDSISTLDKYELVTQENSLGMAYQKNGMSVKLGGNMSYWRLRNHVQRDTLEIGMEASLNYRWKGWGFNADFQKNAVGAFQSSKVTAGIKGHLGRGHYLKIEGTFTEVAPEILQRFYLGNTQQYHLTNPELQNVLKLDMDLKGTISSIEYELRIQVLNTKSVYQWVNNQWSNNENSSSQNLLLGSLGLAKHFKAWYVKPNFQYLLQKDNVLPTFQLGTAVGYSGYITKSKNLFFYTKVNYGYVVGYVPIMLNPLLAQYDYNQPTIGRLNYHDLSITSGFKVKTFQFFLSGGNLGSLWMPSDQALYKGLPIPAWQLQLGIIWEFWN